MLTDAIHSWGFVGYAGTDCSAADNIASAHHYAPDAPHAYAAALNSGATDLICNVHNSGGRGSNMGPPCLPTCAH